MMRNLIGIGLLCSVLLAGCASTKLHQQSVEEVKDDSRLAADEHATDNKMADKDIVEHDAELYVGDIGVEEKFRTTRLQALEEKGSPQQERLLAPNGFPLVKGSPDPSISPIKGSYVENVIEAAKSYLGTPYVWGADRMNPASFDCSSFTRWVYLYALGIDLPWESRSQAAYVQAFSKRHYTHLSQARRGDLLFFTRFLGNRPSDYAGLKASDKPISHMGIYLGNGKIIHTASKDTGGVRIDTIWGKHLEYRLVMGGGVLD